MGKQSFFHPRQEHHRKLQSFGGMQRHQGKLIVIQLGVVDIGDQRHMFQETGQGLFFPFIFQEILGHADQLFQVFRPALGLWRTFRKQFFQITRLVHHVINELFHWNRVRLCH